jgi:hypothetical protein
MRGIPVSVPGLPQTRDALVYAREQHRGQVREVDGAPFVAHPREVASILYAAGAPDHLIAAGALHDVIEKTPVTGFDLRRRFGSTIAALVLAVSEDEHISGYAERKGALRHQVAEAGEEALMLFAADKIPRPASCASRFGAQAADAGPRNADSRTTSSASSFCGSACPARRLSTSSTPSSPRIDRPRRGTARMAGGAMMGCSSDAWQEGLALPVSKQRPTHEEYGVNRCLGGLLAGPSKRPSQPSQRDDEGACRVRVRGATRISRGGALVRSHQLRPWRAGGGRT